MAAGVRARWRRGSKALSDGVWLGLMDPDDLRALDQGF